MEKELSHLSAEIKEQEKSPEQIIMENLFDPFSQDWLVHSTHSDPYNSQDKLKKILEQGILSKEFADRANNILTKRLFKQKMIEGNNEKKDHNQLLYEEMNKKINVDILWPKFQSEKMISAYSKPKLKKDLIVKFWTRGVGIVFSRDSRDMQEGRADDEILCQWRVAPRRFKFLILPFSPYRDDFDALQKERSWSYYCDLAQKHFLPIGDIFFNLLWPMRMSANELQEIGIANLKLLCKKIGFETLKEMSVEEIKKRCQAKTQTSA